jgi:hypothetical protein
MKAPKKANGGSIHDYLTQQGRNGSYGARKQLAQAMGIKNYSGTAEQNLKMLSMLKRNPGTLNQQPTEQQPGAAQRSLAKPGQNKTVQDKSQPGQQPIPQTPDGYVDLKQTYGLDPLSRAGVEKAMEISKKNPKTRYVCTAKGCAEIAVDVAEAFGQDFTRANAWDLANKNKVEKVMKSYQDKVGTNSGPLPDPTDFRTNAGELTKGKWESYIVGLNRKNNNYGSPATAALLAGTKREVAQKLAADSYDYGNQSLYPGSRGYEHVGYMLQPGTMLHGTGANLSHPAFYVVDNTKDGIELGGYGKYDPVELIRGVPDGKKATGGETGDPENPLSAIKKAMGSNGTALPNVDPAKNDLNMSNYLSDVIGGNRGTNPMKSTTGQWLYNLGNEMYGESVSRKLINSAMLFNQRPDLQNMSQEQRINTYFQNQDTDPEIQAIKEKLRVVGYNPAVSYQNSPMDWDGVNSKTIPATGVKMADGGNPFAISTDDAAISMAPDIMGGFRKFMAGRQPGAVAPDNNGMQTMKRTTWGPNPGMAAIGLTGLSFLNNGLEAKDRNRDRAAQIRMGMSDSFAPIVEGSRGDYSTNEGYFRPDQYTPVQFADGGGFQDLTPEAFTQSLPMPANLPAMPSSFDFPDAPPAPAADEVSMDYDNPVAATKSTPEAVEATGTVKPNVKDAFRYYVNKGLAPHIAAGIVGNLYQESGLKTSAVEKSNTANGRGIAQWDVRDRWKGLLKWANNNHRDPYDLKTQLDYVLVEPWESDQVMKKLENTKTPEEAAYIFGKHYERPNAKYARWDARKTTARNLMTTKFAEGGEYSMSTDEIAQILDAGGEVEFL